ncbi:CamS family sex pheromone protein, partial [Virgibacillus halodenitrificans]|nr:CamS family sex pheromone protein [Virgibacillus halodenitrificans]
GVITNQVGNRLDIDEMEEGLRRHSKEVFSPKDYLFQEGQFLEKDLLYDWLSRDLTKKQFDEALEAAIDKRKKDKQPVSDQWLAYKKEELRRGLNPPIKDMTDEMKTKEKKELQVNSPKYVTHVLEQNFLKKKEDKSVEVAGMSIGIAMKSVYRYQTETGGAYYYRDIPKKEMLEKGNEVAQTI